jgi:hypothetical protein
MKKRLILYCVLAVLHVVTIYALVPAATQSFENQIIGSAIQAALPAQWKIVEIKSDEIPWGHYWSTEYKGKKGQMIIIEGPSEISCNVRDNAGKWNTVHVAKETIELWIMPSNYNDTWKRFLDPHRPIPAEEIFKSKIGKVYGKTAHRLKDEKQFKELLKNITEISWPDSPHNTGRVSWLSWQEEIKRKLQTIGK